VLNAFASSAAPGWVPRWDSNRRQQEQGKGERNGGQRLATATAVIFRDFGAQPGARRDNTDG
jgi:hypothetical protein